MHLATLFTILVGVNASRFFRGDKKTKTCHPEVEHQKLFARMIVGESPAKISAALKKSKCVSLKTLIDALNEESMTWNNKRFLSVAEILAELAELAALAKDGVSVVRIISLLISVG
jgi:hypothetical protein